jgi:hypothetical protein
VTTRQHGRITVAQLQRLGVDRSRVARWIGSGDLKPVLPRVYAVGHTAPSREADLWAAVLYAGPGAALSHATAAQWRGLIDYAPRLIEVSTTRKVRSTTGLSVYARRPALKREVHQGIPVTPIPQTMLDLAATSALKVVNRALGQLDFQHVLDAHALLAACGPGRPGSRRLKQALFAYDPALKYANGPLEVDFYDLCKRRGLPLPRLNVHLHGIRVDAYWEEAALVVETDGEDNHSSRAQRQRDRHNDLTLRSHGLTVLRYDSVLVRQHRDLVEHDVLAALSRYAS